MGGGRKKMSDSIDPDVGLWFHTKLGDSVQPGQPLASVFVRNEKLASRLELWFQDSFTISTTRSKVPPLIHAEIL
jgi:thymidine phosphorylase